MIHTSKQLKDKIRNISKSDSRIAQALIRNFVMERFFRTCISFEVSGCICFERRHACGIACRGQPTFHNGY